MLRGLKETAELGFGGGKRCQDREFAAIQQVFHEFGGVLALLVRLLVEVSRKALEVRLLAPDSKCNIGMGRAQLVVQLSLKFGKNGWLHRLSGHFASLQSEGQQSRV